MPSHGIYERLKPESPSHGGLLLYQLDASRRFATDTMPVSRASLGRKHALRSFLRNPWGMIGHPLGMLPIR